MAVSRASRIRSSSTVHVLCFDVRQLFIDLNGCAFQVNFNVSACIVSLNIHALILQRLLFIHNIMLRKKIHFCA